MRERQVRAIIIQDHEARALLNKLKLEAVRPRMEGAKEDPIQRAHGIFHYEVCRWLQEMGCNTVRCKEEPSPE